jgi:hypothetical protein
MIAHRPSRREAWRFIGIFFAAIAVWVLAVEGIIELLHL